MTTTSTEKSQIRPSFSGWRKHLADRVFKYGKLAGMCLATRQEPYRVYLKGVEDTLEAVYQDLVLAEDGAQKVSRLDVRKDVRYRLLENLTVIYDDIQATQTEEQREREVEQQEFDFENTPEIA